jgi:hypothetical protein
MITPEGWGYLPSFLSWMVGRPCGGGDPPGLSSAAAPIPGPPPLHTTPDATMKFFSYTTKHHLKRRVQGTDWLFLGALLALFASIAVLMMYV